MFKNKMKGSHQMIPRLKPQSKTMLCTERRKDQWIKKCHTPASNDRSRKENQ